MDDTSRYLWQILLEYVESNGYSLCLRRASRLRMFVPSSRLLTNLVWSIAQQKGHRSFSLNVAVVGDHWSGKSTLMGRMLYDAGAFARHQISEVKSVCDEGNCKCWAFILSM
jgi:hypothetical protein